MKNKFQNVYLQFITKLALFAILFFIYSNAVFAEYKVSLLNISPAVIDISDQFTDKPPRSVFFLYQGVIGTNYTATFSVSDDAAVTVGVGIDIGSLHFDDIAKTITINFTFVKAFAAPPDKKNLPSNSFLISFDPGKASPTQLIPRTPTPLPTPTMPTNIPPTRPPPVKPGDEASPRQTPDRRPIVQATATPECYGPGNKNDRNTGSSTVSAINNLAVEDQGPPKEARGTYMSTDIFNWCVISPSDSNPKFGFRLGGPSGDKGFFKMFVPKQLVNLLASQSGKSEFAASDLAIFNGDSQASTSVTGIEGGGAIINIQLTFDSNSTIVNNRSSSTTALAKEIELAKKKISVRAESTSQTEKTLTVEEQEPLSLAPKNFKITTKKVALYGFVTNESELAGKKVNIYRVKTGTKAASVRASKTSTKIGSATVKSDGSYSASLKALSVFNSSKKVTLQSSLTSSTVRNSRQVSLSTTLANLRN